MSQVKVKVLPKSKAVAVWCGGQCVVFTASEAIDLARQIVCKVQPGSKDV